MHFHCTLVLYCAYSTKSFTIALLLTTFFGGEKKSTMHPVAFLDIILFKFRLIAPISQKKTIAVLKDFER